MLNNAKRMAALAVSSLLLSGSLVAAQEATPQASPNGTIVCDSSLVLDLYTAEHFFGFSQIMSMVQNPDPALMADVSTLDKGQYAPLFATLNTPVPVLSMSQDQMQSVANSMVLNNDALQAQMATVAPAGTDFSTMTALNMPAIAGEDPTCTVLRTQLTRFYTALNLQNIPNMAATGGSPAASPDATAEPGAGGAIGSSNSTGSSINGNGGASNSTNIPGNGSQLTPPPGGSSPGGNG